jgi:Zn finger protein HypA/HybF involved in hydrogenase expression
MKQRKIRPQAPEDYAMRCYSCNATWRSNLQPIDKVYEMTCPECKKPTVEIDIGK